MKWIEENWRMILMSLLFAMFGAQIPMLIKNYVVETLVVTAYFYLIYRMYRLEKKIS